MGAVVVFSLLAGMAALSIASVLTINPEAIDNARARGLIDGDNRAPEKPSAIKVFLHCKGLAVFCLCCLMFHLANAAMLPLVGQKLALANQTWWAPRPTPGAANRFFSRVS
jgi:cytochrome c5